MPEPIVVIVTCPNRAEADEIARQLVEDRLVACVNVAGRIYSFFRWEGDVARETEYMLLMKTTRDRFERLAERVKELHSYDVPEVIALPIIAGNDEYLDWVRRSTAEG